MLLTDENTLPEYVFRRKNKNKQSSVNARLLFLIVAVVEIQYHPGRF